MSDIKISSRRARKLMTMKKDFEHLTEDDLIDFESTYGDNFILTDLLKLVELDDYIILHQSRMYGWGDTEVREKLYELSNKHNMSFN